MKLETTNKMNSRRASERGAALVTMLLVSVLLLGAGGALVMSTMMSANNSIGSTPEMQAYYVAESGMQSALNVLRGNTQPLAVATDRMSFRTAVIPDISNGPGNNGVLRLAGWLPYNDADDPASLVPVNLGTIAGGYRVTVENMDPNSHIVEFQTSGTIDGSDPATSSQRTFNPGGANEVTIRYSSQALTNLTPDPNNFPLTLDSALGSFVIERPLSSTADDVAIPVTGFEITITQSLPWAATTTLEGTFSGEVDNAATTMQVTFDKVSVKADGTNYALNLGGGTVLNLTYTASPSTTVIPAKVTSPDPKRLLLRSFGFGPQGAEKRLELMLTRAYFEFESPAGITIRGADDCSTNLTLLTGQAGQKIYSGVDAAGEEPQRPAFAVSPCDEEAATNGLEKPDTISDPKIGVLGDDDTTPGTVETPSFLDSAAKARAYLNGLESKAKSLNRYFESTSERTINDSLNSPMFTFVDGDCTLMNGSGFLVVTGTLTMRGNTNFRGSILVLGTGVLIRNGGGDGDIMGGITIAAFGRESGGFTAPTFNTNGGGKSTVQYDSAALKNAIGSGTNVSGVREF